MKKKSICAGVLIAVLLFLGCSNPSSPSVAISDLDDSTNTEEPVTYSVTYKGNVYDGGDVPVDDVEYEEGETFHLADSGTMSKTGYNFTGWTLEGDSGSTVYTGNFTMLDHDLVFLADWSVQAVYTITFNVDGGSTVSSQDVTEGNKIIEPAAPIKPGYSFSGWFKDAGLSDSWDFVTDIVTENYTLYAKWQYVGDISAPNITGFTIETASIDTSTGDDFVTFTISATDDLGLRTDINGGKIELRSPSGTILSAYIDNFDGTSIAGTYTVIMTVPQFSEAGTWTVTKVYVYDNLGKIKIFGNADLINAGYNYSVININP